MLEHVDKTAAEDNAINRPAGSGMNRPLERFIDPGERHHQLCIQRL